MRKLLIEILTAFSLIILFSNTVFGQSKFLPGSIVYENSDTIKGLIDYKRWKQNPTEIKFKVNESSDVQKYGPENISSFQVSSDVYQSRQITITESPDDTEFITDLSPQPYTQQTAFVLVLVSGKASLYHFLDNKNIDHFYIETQEQSLLELTYFTYYRYQNNTRVQSENRKYVGQMIAYLNDCPDIISQIEKTKYSITPLKKVVANYNACLNDTDFYVQNTKDTKLRVGVFAGATFSNLSFNDPSDTYGYLSDVSFSNSILPTFGVSLLLEPGRGNGRWALYIDLLVKNQYYNGHYNETFHEDYYIDYDINLGTTSMNMTFMGRYSFTGNKIVPYIGAGGYFGINVANTNQETLKTHFYDTYRERTQEVFPTGIGGFDFGLAAEIGVCYKKFFLDLRFDYERMTPYPPVSTAYSFYLILGYTFN